MKTKQQQPTALIIRSSLALALALAIWSPVQAQSAEPAEGKKMTEGKMMDSCNEMMQAKQKMTEEMKAQDAELAELVAGMNSAPEAKKMALTAKVVTRMVEQQSAMNAKHEAMQAKMMQHMMEHMEMGKESMAQCPMMKDMKSMEEKSGDAHKHN
ncbi:MAG: hypothetical protein ABIY47_06590 [Opitutaceae bacterium]